MNKSVLISIQPKWCELIANGKKTVEVRKTAPKLQTPFKCYIYYTRGHDMLWVTDERHRDIGIACLANAKALGGANKANSKVIGEFVCDYIDEFSCDSRAHRKLSEWGSCLTEQEIQDYCNGQTLYGWHISDLKIYDTPKELGEFRKAGYMTEEQWLYALYPNTHCHYAAWAKRFEIKHAPQSWCYIEELKA